MTPNIFDFFDAVFSDMEGTVGNTQFLYGGTYPPVDVLVHEETKDLRLVFAMAGIPRDRILVYVDGEYLSLKILKPEEKSKDSWKCVQRGIKQGAIERKFLIPASKYRLDKTEVDFSDGILSVFIPAKEHQARKKVF